MGDPDYLASAATLECMWRGDKGRERSEGWKERKEEGKREGREGEGRKEEGSKHSM